MSGATPVVTPHLHRPTFGSRLVVLHVLSHVQQLPFRPSCFLAHLCCGVAQLNKAICIMWRMAIVLLVKGHRSHSLESTQQCSSSCTNIFHFSGSRSALIMSGLDFFIVSNVPQHGLTHGLRQIRASLHPPSDVLGSFVRAKRKGSPVSLTCSAL